VVAEGESMNKYHAVKTVVDGYTFDSKAEAQYYIALREMLKDGEISNLKVHPRYELQSPFYYRGERIPGIYYEADFSYIKDGKRIAVDVKGYKTDVYRLKRKLFLYNYQDYDFQEVK
jgi:hypothetical protein